MRQTFRRRDWLGKNLIVIGNVASVLWHNGVAIARIPIKRYCKGVIYAIETYVPNIHVLDRSAARARRLEENPI